MNHKKVNISISMTDFLRRQLRRAATDDHRSVSSLVTGLLRVHLRREGYATSRSENEDVEVARPKQIRMKFE